MMNRKVIIQFFSGILISSIALVGLFKDQDIHELFSHFKDVNYYWILVVLALMFSMVTRTVVWRFFLERENISFKNLYNILMIGYFLNNLLPGRPGDIARVFLCWKDAQVKRSTVLISLLLEKILDLVWLVLLLLATLISMRSESNLFFRNASIFIAVFGFAMVCLVVLFGKRDYILRTAQHCLRSEKGIKHKLSIMLQSIYDATELIISPTIMIKSFLFHGLTWAFSLLTIWFSLKAFGLNISPLSALLVLVLTNLGMIVPSSPGAIGVYHYLVYLALSVTGVESGIATSFAVFLHFIQYVSILLIGLSCWLFYRGGEERYHNIKLKDFLYMKGSN